MGNGGWWIREERRLNFREKEQKIREEEEVHGKKTRRRNSKEKG